MLLTNISVSFVDLFSNNNAAEYHGDCILHAVYQIFAEDHSYNKQNVKNISV